MMLKSAIINVYSQSHYGYKNGRLGHIRKGVSTNQGGHLGRDYE